MTSAQMHHLPDPLRELIVECTDLDPKQRPKDAVYVKHAFEKAVKRVAQAGLA